MAPLTVANSPPQIEPRALPDQITLSVTHASTTYTTTILLGRSTIVTSNAASTSFFTTTALSAPTQTSQSSLSPSDPSNAPNTGVIVGAVLGSILGTLVLLTLIYKCCVDNRSAAWIPAFPSFYDSDWNSERSSHSSRVHRRGGGGDGFGSDNRRGDTVRRPRGVRTRRSRHREESGRRSERSYGTRYRRRQSTGMNYSNGLLGWFLVPRTRPNIYQYTERKHARSSWGRGEGWDTTDD